MNDTVLRFRILVLAVLLLFALLVSVAPFASTGQLAVLWGSGEGEAGGGYLTVAFLDVGQGDAIFITTPDGVQVLIDGGPDAAVLRGLPQVMPLLDRTIDVVLATHPDKDHIGGLVDVFNRYSVGTIIQTENESDTAVASAFTFSAEAEVAERYLSARAGDVIFLGASTTLEIFSPASDPTNWESNNASIVARLTYGEINFMLTGDASSGIEEYLVGQYGDVLESEVLKLGHHGSKTSSAASFLDAVAPLYAVVSAGADNSYGHPHTEVVARVKERGIKILSTADRGTIVFKSDGARVWVQ